MNKTLASHRCVVRKRSIWLAFLLCNIPVLNKKPSEGCHRVLLMDIFFFVCNIQITSQLCTVNGHHSTESNCSEGTTLLNYTDLPAVDLMC